MERTFKTEGIILSRKNFGEADKIVTVLTKHYGKLRVRAPGVRRITSRKAPHLELFNLASLLLVQGKNMDIVTEAQTANGFFKLKRDLPKVSLAYYFCELVDRFCPERQENKEVYDLLTDNLENLNTINSNDVYHCSEDFANQLLWNLGFLQRSRKLAGVELERYIENISERKLKSPQLLRKTNG